MKGCSRGKCFITPMCTLTLALSPSPALLLEGYKMQQLICMELSSPVLHHPVAGEAGSLCWSAVIDRLGAAAVWVASRVQLSGGLTGAVRFVTVKGPSLRLRYDGPLYCRPRRETWAWYFSHLALRSFFNYWDIIYRWGSICRRAVGVCIRVECKWSFCFK